MRVVPAEILDVKSAAEKRIHGFLRQVTFGQADVALHSLNLAHHEYKRWGEADFVLLTRRGMLLIEVKGGRVACRNGVWEFKNRFGQVTRKRESPAAQAKSAFFSLLESYLRPRFGHELDGLTMGWGVVFDGVDRLVTVGKSALPEQPDQITAYRQDCLGHNSFNQYLKRAFGHWLSRTRGSRPKEMPDQLIAETAAFLRPNFEKVPSLNSQLFDFNEELCHFSDEQCARLDEIQENDRIVIEGGAGTGKTFLAVACARYEAARARRVLLFTKSPHLATFLRAHNMPAAVTICSSDDLDSLSSCTTTWDTLVVDEGQDLCQVETVVALSDVLRGGLEAGRWRWFGDPNNQVAPSTPFDTDAYDYLSRMAFRTRLNQNVRNAPPIVDCIHEIAKADVGKPRAKGVGSKVKYTVAANRGAISQAIVEQVVRWTSSKLGVRRSDIAVLMPDDGACAVVVDELNSAGIRAELLSAKALSGNRRDCVIVSSVADFKGLEKPVVCVGGLSPNANDETMRRTALRRVLSSKSYALGGCDNE